GCAPWPHFYPALSGRGSDPDITAVTRKGDFFLTRFDGEPSLRLRDCRNGLLLLSLEDSSLCIYDPVSKRRVGIPRRPHDGTAGSQCLADCLLDAGRGTGTSSTVRQCGQRMMPQAMESFRVVSLQQQSQEIRALVYDSNTLEWHHHPWVSPPTDGIKRLPKWGTTAMYAAGNVFWRCAQQSLVLVLETSTMEFSLRPLPPDLSFHVPSRYAIGEIEDGKGCLVCLTGLTGEETPTLEVWVLDTNMWKLHSSLNNKLWKLDSSEKWWRLEKKIPVSQLLGESARVRQVRMVINGLALLCKDDHDPQFVVDLQSMALLAKFQFRGYPYQMSWPPAGLATTNSRSTSSLEDTNIDIAPVLPEGELSESGSRKKSDESGMHLEESCNRGFKLNGDGDHEVGNLRKYHVKLNPSVSLVYSVFGYLTLRRERCG
uniref:F-box associated domain-containing protein n=1 Tax=Aegilops tauschii subsp. strangulata TaxID=200361 RepID=A0A452XMF9_AEGTS